MVTLPERLEGGLDGLLFGDALGVPYEFHRTAEIPPLAEIEFEPPAHFRRSYNGGCRPAPGPTTAPKP
jgi:ADP-ribosyl-[dinitrogen reductase] hydrolase